MADVFKAVDTHLNNRLYAVKLLSSSTLSHANPDLIRELFLAEAAALSRIRDNNVVQIVSNGLLGDANQTPYMVMEYLDGQDLSALLKAEKQLPIDRAVDIILAVCAGINACHLAGVIHRDLKPANIFLDQTLKGEEPKVLDFSVAKIPLSSEQTNTDFVVGTENYMAPEVANGRPANERSDQYSIGALLYRCLTGQVPRGLLSNPRQLRPEIAEELEAVLLRAMDPTPDRRFVSVHEFGRALLPHGSPLGRAKWNHYYTTPPLPLRAAFSEPLVSVAAPVTSAVGVTQVNAYDFGAHERTTHLAEPSSLGTTIPDGSRPRPSNSKVPVGIPPSPESAGASAISAASPTSTSRRALLLGGGIVFVLLAIGTGAALLRSRSPGEASPLPPAWTRSDRPSAAAPPAPTATSKPSPPEPASITAPTVLHGVPVTGPEGASTGSVMPDGGATGKNAVKIKKRRKQKAASVQYTPAGGVLVP